MRALQFTGGSPFGRAIRILLDELGLEFEQRSEADAPRPGASDEVPPTLQVPTLWDQGVMLWDSGVIAEYLLATYPARFDAQLRLAASLARPESEWADRLTFASIQTFGTAVTTISQLKWTGIGVDENAHLSRCAERLPPILAWLEGQLGTSEGFMPGVLSAQDIFLACHIRFVENRPLGLDFDLARFPRVAEMLRRLDQRASFAKHPITWWQPEPIAPDA